MTFSERKFVKKLKNTVVFPFPISPIVLSPVSYHRVILNVAKYKSMCCYQEEMGYST